MEDLDSLSIPYIPPNIPNEFNSELNNAFSVGSTLPNFVLPVEMDPIHEWKLKHEKAMFDKLIASQQVQRDKRENSKLDALKTIRKVPVLAMTRHFLNKHTLTIDARAYVIDKLVPIVVLGLEALLVEANKRQLIHKEEIEPNFNPIDFLARYLMRNNPLYSNYNEASPYVRGIRQVAEELKVEIFHLSDNKLAKVKSDANNRRKKRETELERQKIEAKRRIEIYQQLFDQFLLANQTKVDYETVHVSIKSFCEIVNQFPDDIKVKLTPFIQMKPTEDKPSKLGRKDFGLLISHYAESMSPEIFNRFSDHLSQCAKMYVDENQKEMRKERLSNLFVTCDFDQVGMLDRQRILMLFNQFYKQSPENVKSMLRDPMNWPIYDYNQANKKVVSEDPPLETKEDESNSNADVEVQNRVDFNNDNIEETQEEDKNLVDDKIEKDLMVDEDNNLKENGAIENQKIELNDESESDSKPNLTEEEALKNKNESNEETEVKILENEFVEESEVVSKQNLIEEQSIMNEDEHIVETDLPRTPGNELTDESKADTKSNLPEESNSDAANAPAASEDHIQSDREEMDEEENDSVLAKSGRKSEKRVQINDQVIFEEDLISENDKDQGSISTGRSYQEFGIEAEMIEDNDDNKESIEEDDNGSKSATQTLLRELTRASTLTYSSAYDDENITLPQLFQVTEEFIATANNIDSSANGIFEELLEFIRENYDETPEERLKRMKKVHRQVASAKRKSLIDELFNVWDQNSVGHLNMKQVSDMLMQYKGGMLEEALKIAKKEARMRQVRQVKTVKLYRKDFRKFLYTVGEGSGLLDEEGEIESMIVYFISLVQKTFQEKMRSEARRKWLENIVWAAEISHGTMQGIYKAVFQALYKDIETHGNGKKASISIALLEDNEKDVENRGKYMLHFMAATSDHEDLVLNKILDKSTGGVSMHCVYSGKFINIAHTSQNPYVVYFDPEVTQAAKEGALSVVPIKDDLQRTYGVIVLDTLRDPNPEQANFSSHENYFFQGVSKQFNLAFQQSELLRKLIGICESGISWICRRITGVVGAELLLKEPAHFTTPDMFVLRRVLRVNGEGDKQKLGENNNRFTRQDNLFKKYLFDAMETSQTINANAYGQRFSAVPIRGIDGATLAIIDINIGTGVQFLPPSDSNQLVHLLAILQEALTETIKSSQPDPEILAPDQLEGNNETAAMVTAAVGVSRAEFMFDQLMLNELKKGVAKLDAQSYAELKSYKDPPVTIRTILDCVLSLIHCEQANQVSGFFRDWEKCKKFINVGLGKLILDFDPLDDDSNQLPLSYIMDSMEKIPSSEIDKHSSKPAKELYNWLFCCVNLIEHRMKMESQQQFHA